MNGADAWLLWGHALLVSAGVACLSIGLRQQDKQGGLSQEHLALLEKFKWKYLPGYLLACSSDWIQGPYQFRVYLTYGLTEAQIGKLYIAGFASSVTLGTYIASLADAKGRRQGCFWYCIVCSLSCLTKNFSAFGVLLLGRVLGGIAASLLFSSFESWCVTAAAEAGLPEKSLGPLFTSASFMNGLTAIMASVLGHLLAVAFATADSPEGNVIAPFNAVPVILLACAAYMHTYWGENYGTSRRSQQRSVDTVPRAPSDAWEVDPGGKQPSAAAGRAAKVLSSFTALREAVVFVASEPLVSLLGVINSLFDAATYVFVFGWTLSLEARSGDSRAIPWGLAFGLFMGWCMIGALVCKMILGSVTDTAGRVAGRLLLVLLCFAGAALVPGAIAGSSFLSVFNGFCMFEAAFGAFMPAMALLRALHLDDGHRAAATALYRVPTNIAVCLVLLNAGFIDNTTILQLCIMLLVVAVCANLLFIRLGGGTVRRNRVSPPDEELAHDEEVSKDVTKRSVDRY
ncbi:hypothetical protein DIPPA_28795 [Diplonema papillatum]|nr:hypothetical protein DIPPA_28795 [Diplonema papillatum]